MTPGGALTTGPAVHRNIGYDPAKAFTPVGLLTETPNIISVHPSLPVKSLAEVVAYAKANPGKISWGSQGFGTAPHLLAEMFKLETGVNIVHVPYRGTAPLLAAAVAGEVQMLADPATSSLPHIQSGNLRVLAIAGAERFSKLPDVPTTPEAGYPKLQAPFWLGVVAPAGTPAARTHQPNAPLPASLYPPPTRDRHAPLARTIWRNVRHAQREADRDRRDGADRRAASAGSGSQSYRPHPHGVRDRRPEGQASAAHHCGRRDLGAGLFRARRGLRPREPFDPGNA